MKTKSIALKTLTINVLTNSNYIQYYLRDFFVLK